MTADTTLEKAFNAQFFRRVSIPFVLEIADDLLGPLDSVPEMRPLGGPLSWEEETGSYGYDVEYYDYEIELSVDQKDLFRSFVNDTNLLLTHLRSAECEWEFLKVALLFLRKAFFSKGLIRLLWNITALDALLGEDQPGRTRLLTSRIASIFGNADAETFRHVYKLRSSLVHGDKCLLDQGATYVSLCDARNLARRTIVWFLHYLNHILAGSRNRKFSTRKELLTAIDHRQNPRIASFANCLPEDFPQTPSWFD